MKLFDAQITFCYTEDPEASYRFYEETLGLLLVLDQGGCRIYRAARGAYLGMCHRLKAPKPSGVILTLVTDDVDRWYEELSAAGVAFEKAPAHNPEYGIYHCFFRDPNGYLLEIQRFDNPAWSGSKTTPGVLFD
jgi:catechol 2,3-dioxygenase-like lactoylglutathione lyase family enzyme